MARFKIVLRVPLQAPTGEIAELTLDSQRLADAVTDCRDLDVGPQKTARMLAGLSGVAADVVSQLSPADQTVACAAITEMVEEFSQGQTGVQDGGVQV